MTEEVGAACRLYINLQIKENLVLLRFLLSAGLSLSPSLPAGQLKFGVKISPEKENNLQEFLPQCLDFQLKVEIFFPENLSQISQNLSSKVNDEETAIHRIPFGLVEQYQISSPSLVTSHVSLGGRGGLLTLLHKTSHSRSDHLLTSSKL